MGGIYGILSEIPIIHISNGTPRREEKPLCRIPDGVVGVADVVGTAEVVGWTVEVDAVLKKIDNEVYTL